MIRWLVPLFMIVVGLLAIFGSPHIQRHAIAYFDRNKKHPIHSRLGTRALVEGPAYVRAMRVVGFGLLIMAGILLTAGT